uniref:Uncharacterized protein n=1 Tax=Psilocybe cubensis TaxID=181762 RepID=A0A8H7Y2E1_PSICU
MAPSRITKSSTRKTAGTVVCPYCNKEVNKRGLAGHQRSASCRATQGPRNLALDNESERQAYDDLLKRYAHSNTFSSTSQLEATLGGTRPSKHSVEWDLDSKEGGGPDQNSSHSEELEPDGLASVHDTEDTSSDHHDGGGGDENIPIQAIADDIKIEYHPSSKQVDEIFRFEDYKSTLPETKPKNVDRKPWLPFRTRLDFELAEFMHDSHLNSSQTSTLLSIIHQSCWEHARALKAQGFSTQTITVPYKGEENSFDLAFRPIWDWCLSLLENPTLAPKFKWDAERHYKFDASAQKWKRFIDEPWTGNAWWKAQSKLPNGAGLLCIILYADKTRLSSFGTQKGYPVMARCGNLPINLRNGEGVGGGRVVGFLPIVEEDAGETGKKGFINFKRVVWHKSFYEIIQSLVDHAKTGFYFSQKDFQRWIYPVILILSADYEEQCVMALIRGTNSNFPCPRCLVPHENLTDFTTIYPLRSAKEMGDIFDEAQELNKTDADKLLQMYGLRNVENVFQQIQNTDIYEALSFDRLHNNHGGVFSDHLWEEYQKIVNNLGKKTAALIDERVDEIPRWSGLNHFRTLMKSAGEFTDGTKYEDISKIIVFASEDILTQDVSEQGFRLLEVIRSYLELDMYSGLTVHTEDTLQSGEAELKTFCELLCAYSADFPDKSWNFPKAHAFRHLFDDIRDKGVTRNYNTKPNEKAHSILKSFYQLHTNFKNVIPQISKLNEKDLACHMIRGALDHLDEFNTTEVEDEQESTIIGTHHVSLGSYLPAISFSEHERQHSSDIAFHGFRKKLGQTLSRHLGKPVRFDKHDVITPYQYMEVNYESKITWKTERNILRINPSFHGRKRYDHALIQVDSEKNTYIFVQLLYVIGIKVEETLYHMALVLPLDEAIPALENHRISDKKLRFIRVRSRHRSKAAFINVESIVRGGLLAQAFRPPHQVDEYIIIDVIDEDMWWRLKSVKLVKHVVL